MTDTIYRAGRSRWWAALVVAFLLGGLCGAIVVRQRIFPYPQLTAAKRLLFPRDVALRPRTIETSLVRLEKRTYNPTGPSRLMGFGGGLARVRGAVLGVDRTGTFFVYQSADEIRTMDLGLDSNREAYLRHVARVVPDESARARLKITMRVAGIAARETDDGLHLFVSHHFWHADRAEKSLRISRLVVLDVDALLAGRSTGDPHAWEVVFESSPRIAFDPADPSPFNTNHSGGRIAFASDGALLVGIGDQRYDGVTVPQISSQDDTSSYGKVLRIDPDSREVAVHALGFRNPLGLTFDRDGNLWATDHGPEGGDELNTIVAGANYGWPFATLGTDHGALHWPLNPRQGRHDGFVRPVYSWTPSIGISSVIQVQHEPDAWDGDLLVASMFGRTLYRVRVTGGRVAFAEPIPIGERIRDLVQLNDSSFLLWVDSGRVIELRAVAGESHRLPIPLTASEKEQGLTSVLSQCGACHGFDDATPATRAPSLRGVAGRRIGGSPYPNYSDALKDRGGFWDDAALRAFLTDPQSFAEGTHMPAVPMEPGMVAAVVRYLRRLD